MSRQRAQTFLLAVVVFIAFVFSFMRDWAPDLLRPSSMEFRRVCAASSALYCLPVSRCFFQPRDLLFQLHNLGGLPVQRPHTVYGSNAQTLP